MKLNLTIPARINLLGNPADANEGDFAAISAALNLYAGASIEPADHIVLEACNRVGDQLVSIQRQEFTPDQVPLPYTGELDLVKGAVNRLSQYSAGFRTQLAKAGFHLATWTNVPRQSGLGGSSLFVLLALASLRAFYELDHRRLNDYVLAELAQRVESKELGITCGFADRYVPLFGGLAYVDYRGKLQHRGLDAEPYATYERLDEWVDDLPLVMISTGVVRDSGDVHGRMRPRYLEEYAEWEARGGPQPPMVSWMSGAWETAWRGKIALLKRDWETVGALMSENHRLVNAMMEYCGFPDGAGWANNRLIEVALNEGGALGAKLTGAGGGGSVFALTQPDEEDKLVAVWTQAATEAGLIAAQVRRPRIVRQGLRVEAA